MERERDPEVMAEAIRSYLAAHPVLRVVEGDLTLLDLGGAGAGATVEAQARAAVLHLWSRERSLVRRVVELRRLPRGLQLATLRLGRARPSPLRLEPAGHRSLRLEAQRSFRSAVFDAMARAWPQWRGAEPDSPASPSQPLLPRVPGLEFFFLRRGLDLCACVAAAPTAGADGGELALTELLAWARPGGGFAAGSAAEPPRTPAARPCAAHRVIVPPGGGATAQIRLAGLRRAESFEVFELVGGDLRAATPVEEGNLFSALRRPLGAPPLSAGLEGVAEMIRRGCPSAERAQFADGTASFQLHGLTILKQASGAAALRARWAFPLWESAGERGRRPKEPRWRPLTAATEPEFRARLERLYRERDARGDAGSPLFRLRPEAWMETELRRQISALDPCLAAGDLHRQVPARARAQCEIMDLLGARRDGRLCVFELKAEEDLQFPLQALEYWLAVSRHLRAGDFERLGFFGGRALRRAPPLLVMIAPALRWHPRMPGLLAWLKEDVPWIRLGVNEQWRAGLRVVQREAAPAAQGAFAAAAAE